MGRLSELDPIERGAVLGFQDSRLREVADWYARQSGLPVTRGTLGRLLEILAYLERANDARPDGAGSLDLSDLALTVTTDTKWPQRAVRTREEREAVSIGRGGGVSVYVYVKNGGRK